MQKSNTNTWKVATFLIEDGYFGNRRPGGADFYIDTRSDTGVNDGDEYIHHIDVQKRNNVAQLTPSPTPTGGVPTTTPVLTPTPTATPTPGSSSLAGYVFEDTNLNYLRDPGEQPLPGALVKLLTSSNTLIMQVSSDSNGYFLFPNLTPNVQYIVRVEPPPGWAMRIVSQWVFSAPGIQTIINFAAERLAAYTPPTPATPSATSTPTLTPTITPTSTPVGGLIRGIVWHDADQGGLDDIDPGEEAVANVVLRLYTVSGQLLRQTSTAADGSYEIAGLPNQTYRLALTLPAGWQATTPIEHWLASGAGVIQINFGIMRVGPTPTPTATPQAVASVGVLVWHDLNRNQSVDDGEPPLTGAVIIVYKASGLQEVARSLTGGDGRARFDNLPAPANYKVMEIDPWGMASSTNNDLFIVVSPGE